MTTTAETAVADTVDVAQSVRVDLIDPSPKNRKLSDDMPDVQGFAEELRTTPLVNPIRLRPRDAGRFEIVCGERRWRAFRVLGRTEIPAFVRDMSDSEAQLMRLVENLHRVGLTHLQEGEGIAALLEECAGDVAEVAGRLGQKESWVRRRAKLPKLSDAWREELAKENTDYPHIRDSIERLEEIAIMPRETQDAVLEAGLLLWTKKTADMRQALARFFRDLDQKPWTREWEKKNVSGRKRCDACLKRSDKEKTLFDGITEAAGKPAAKFCLDPECWQGRVFAWCHDLLQDNPEACILWDGHAASKDEAACNEEFGQRPLAGHEWEERTTEEPEDESYPKRGVGLFVGGARVGKLIDIWVEDEEADKQLDREIQEKHEASRREADEADRRRQALRAKIAALLPENVGAFAQAAKLGDLDLAVLLLNWGGWLGIGEMRYRAAGFDVLNTRYDEYPGRQHAWNELRGELLTLLYEKIVGDEEEFTPNDTAITSFLAESLSIDLAALQQDFSAGVV